MNFKDLVSKLDELSGPNAQQLGTGARGPTVMPKIPTDPNVQQNPLGTGAGPRSVAQKALQAGQSAQAAATPPAEKPIPGQQPNLGPKAATAPVPPQQVIGAPPAPQQQQQNNTGMAAAILQAVNQMKTQQPTMAPTSSQSISAQQQDAVKQATGLQQTAKPGEPLEEVQVDEWGDWRPEWMGGPKKGETKKPQVAPSKIKDLDDAGIENWTKALSSDPNNVTHPNWENISPTSKQKIISAIKKADPNASNYIEAIRKHGEERRKSTPNEEELAKLEKEKGEARLKWNTTETEPATPVKPAATEPDNKEPVIRSPINKEPAKPAATEPAKPAATEPAKPAKPAGPVVTSAELQKFRDEQGNQNITLGQYLNHKNKLTARKGGANDAEVIQKQLGDKGAAWNPELEKIKKLAGTDTANKNTTTTTYTPPAANNTVASVVVPDNTPVSTAPTKASDGGPALTPAQLKWMGNADQTDPNILARMRSAVPDTNTSTVDTSAQADNTVAGTATKKSNSVLDNVLDYFTNMPKKDANGRTYLDTTGQGTDYSKKSNFEPAAGPIVRDTTPKTVGKEPVKEISLQALVDELLSEDATLPMTQPKPSAWNKTRDIVTKTNNAVKTAIPKPVRDTATVISNVPGVKPVVRGVVGGLGALGAVADTADAYDRYEKGDYKGAAIRGIGAVGGAAQMAKHPVAVGLGFAAQQGADWYLDKYDAERAAEKNGITKEDQELYDILKLSGKVK